MRSDLAPVGRSGSPVARGWALRGSIIGLVAAAACAALAGACVVEGKAKGSAEGTSTGPDGGGGSGASGGSAHGGGAGGLGAGGAAGHGGSGGEGGTPAVEVCNFRDDDGDGLVDEGFAWQAGSWMTVFHLEPSGPNPVVQEIDRNLYYPEAIRLSDGRVAVAALEGRGDGNIGYPDHGLVLVLSGAGERLLGPTFVTIGTSGGDHASIAEGPNGEIAALYAGTDYSLCTVACPAYVARHDPTTLNLIDVPQGGPAPVELPFSPWRFADLVWTGDEYVLAGRDVGRQMHVSWLNAQATAVVADRTPAAGDTFTSSLVPGDAGLVWARSSTPNPWSSLDVGIFTADGTGTVLPATEVVANSNIYLSATEQGRHLAWLDGGMVLAYVVNPLGEAQAMLARIAPDASVLAGPARLGGTAAEIRDVIVVDGSIIALVDNANLSATVHRLDAALEPIDAPVGDVTFGTNTGYLTMAVGDESLLVFRTAPGVGDGSFSRNLDVMRVGCAADDRGGGG